MDSTQTNRSAREARIVGTDFDAARLAGGPMMLAKAHRQMLEFTAFAVRNPDLPVVASSDSERGCEDSYFDRFRGSPQFLTAKAVNSNTGRGTAILGSFWAP